MVFNCYLILLKYKYKYMYMYITTKEVIALINILDSGE